MITQLTGIPQAGLTLWFATHDAQAVALKMMHRLDPADYDVFPRPGRFRVNFHSTCLVLYFPILTIYTSELNESATKDSPEVERKPGMMVVLILSTLHPRNHHFMRWHILSPVLIHLSVLVFR